MSSNTSRPPHSRFSNPPSRTLENLPEGRSSAVVLSSPPWPHRRRRRSANPRSSSYPSSATSPPRSPTAVSAAPPHAVFRVRPRLTQARLRSDCRTHSVGPEAAPRRRGRGGGCGYGGARGREARAGGGGDGAAREPGAGVHRRRDHPGARGPYPIFLALNRRIVSTFISAGSLI